ncbi:MAG TPA: hypothetical protein DD417_08180 [Elusimicrobia bacterium]|nr:hypothetical protein [Elusimicrobiota bacterium]
MEREPRIAPGEHLVRDLLRDDADADEAAQDLAAHDFKQTLQFGVRGDRDFDETGVLGSPTVAHLAH